MGSSKDLLFVSEYAKWHGIGTQFQHLSPPKPSKKGQLPTPCGGQEPAEQQNRYHRGWECVASVGEEFRQNSFVFRGLLFLGVLNGIIICSRNLGDSFKMFRLFSNIFHHLWGFSRGWVCVETACGEAVAMQNGSGFPWGGQGSRQTMGFLPQSTIDSSCHAFLALVCATALKSCLCGCGTAGAQEHCFTAHLFVKHLYGALIWCLVSLLSG